MRRALLALAGLACLGGAVESGPVRVLRVVDGDTVDVAADLGGLTHAVRVRLLHVDTAEANDNPHGAAMPEGRRASEFLRGELPPGTVVRLAGPGEALARDRSGRVLAIVLLGDGAETVQTRLIRAGWSAYWRKYGEAPAAWHDGFAAVEREAREAGAGAWTTAPGWMRDKANERTAAAAGATRVLSAADGE